MEPLKKNIDEALARPMDRREFLVRAGAVALSLAGVTAAIKTFTGKSTIIEAVAPTPRAATKPRTSVTAINKPNTPSGGGYGSSPYGV